MYRPREAVKHLKSRLIKKNGKIQYLTLELIDMAMLKCKLPFHTQVASKDFMNVIVRLGLMKDIPQNVIFLLNSSGLGS